MGQPERVWVGADLRLGPVQTSGYVSGPGLMASVTAPALDGDGTVSLRFTHLDSGRIHEEIAPVMAGTTVGLSWTLPLDFPRQGIVLAVARREPERLIRWAWSSQVPEWTQPSLAPELRQVYTSRTLARMLALYDPQSTGTWLGNNPAADIRWMREDIYLVVGLLERGEPGDLELARTLLRHICQSQHRQPGDFADGQFLYSPVEYPAPDQSTTQFILPVLLWILDTRSHQLDPETVAMAEDAARRALGFKKRYYGPLSNLSDFTNFQTLAIASLTMGGRRFSDPEALEIGRRQMDLLWNRLSTTGFSAEFQSPTYVAVGSWALALLLDSQASDPDLRAKSALMLQRLGLEAAIAAHPKWRQMAGPYSRTFSDGLMGGATLTSLMLAVETGDGAWAAPERLGPVYEADHSLDLNPSVLMGVLGPRWDEPNRQVVGARMLPVEFHHRHLGTGRATGWMAPDGTLGTAVSRRNSQTEAFLVQVATQENPGGISPVVLRAGSDGASGLSFVPVDTGLYRMSGVQTGPRALVVQRRQFAGSDPELLRVAATLVLEERFGRWQDLKIEGQTVELEPGQEAVWAPGQWFTARRGDGWIGIRGLSVRGSGQRAQPGRLTRTEQGLFASLHALDQSTSVAASAASGEWVWAVEIGGANSSRESYSGFVERLESSIPPWADHGTTTVEARWEMGPKEGPVTPAPALLQAQWDRQNLNRLEDRRQGQDFLIQEDFVVSPDVVMPGPASRGRTVLGDFQCEGLAPGAWLVRPMGTNRVTALNPTSATMSLTHSWSGDNLVVPPWQWRTLDRDGAGRTGAQEWDQYK